MKLFEFKTTLSYNISWNKVTKKWVQKTCAMHNCLNTVLSTSPTRKIWKFNKWLKKSSVMQEKLWQIVSDIYRNHLCACLPKTPWNDVDSIPYVHTVSTTIISTTKKRGWWGGRNHFPFYYFSLQRTPLRQVLNFVSLSPWQQLEAGAHRWCNDIAWELQIHSAVTEI